MTAPARLVVDTNVVLSGLLFPGSIPSRVLLEVQGSVILASNATRQELTEVIERTRFDRYVQREVRRRLAAEFLRATVNIEVPSPIRACRDPRDDKFLEVAMHGLADAIVTGDRDLLELNPFHGVAILSPAEYLEHK
jgi:putative PIN family toxin of toxin-antitoxin system